MLSYEGAVILVHKSIKILCFSFFPISTRTNLPPFVCIYFILPHSHLMGQPILFIPRISRASGNFCSLSCTDKPSPRFQLHSLCSPPLQHLFTRRSSLNVVMLSYVRTKVRQTRRVTILSFLPSTSSDIMCRLIPRTTARGSAARLSSSESNCNSFAFLPQ
jgi:hypothetical protein